MSELGRQVGAAVRAHRLRHGLSQTGLAEALHVSHGTISALERGARPLLLDDVLALCDALDVSFKDLTWFMSPEDVVRLGL